MSRIERRNVSTEQPVGAVRTTQPAVHTPLQGRRLGTYARSAYEGELIPHAIVEPHAIIDVHGDDS
jgi:hypothetical protein